jgi:hypothetical protein
VEELTLRRDLKNRVLGVAAIERSRRRQASRLIWLKEDDACTRFFHLRANGRARKKYIPYLKKQDNSYLWSHSEKEAILHNYFHDILGTCHHRIATIQWDELSMPLLPEQCLDQPFSEVEVKKVILELPAKKVPGLDGFTGVFFRTYWEVIKHDIMAAFQCIHNQKARPLPKLNGAVLTLLPKKEVADSPRDFRPISLIHSFAKLVSKVLALRLAPHIDDLISNAHSAFIKNRCIQDNYLYVRNLARAYHRKKVPAILMKLDIS